MSEKKEENKNQLVDYVIQKITEKISGDEIKKQLRAVGWSEDEADKVYALSLTKCGIPVPNQGDEKIFSKKSTAGEIVANIFSFVVLGFIAINFGILCYNIIDYFFPNVIANSGSIKASSESIHYTIASLIVSFPIYFFTIKFWFKRFKEDEGKIESALTKWITYLVLLIVSLVLVGDLVAVIFFFLQGDVTTRFFLKALTIFVITGGIFGFYFNERKRIQYKKPVSKNVFYSFGIVTFILILVAIIIGFSIAGSPSTERSRAMDKTRATDLNSISNCVSRYAKEFQKFPTSLDSMTDLSGYTSCANRKDPKTKDTYEYKITKDLKEESGIVSGEFELCANFELEMDEDTLQKEGKSSYYLNDTLSKWEKHSAGRECDKVEVMIKKKENSSVPVYLN